MRSGDAAHAAPNTPNTNSAHEASPNDALLIRRVAEDDDEALRLLYRRYAGLVYSLARRMLGDEARAEEMLQETFLRVWRAAITYDPARGSVEAWVVTIARNLIVSTLRKRNAAEEPLDEELQVADSAPSPEEATERNTQRALVRQAIDLLPDHQKQMVMLAYFDGLTHIEIAARTGEPLGTVKSRLRLALRRLEANLRVTFGDAWEWADAEPR